MYLTKKTFIRFVEISAAAAVGGGGVPFKYAFNSLDGALPLMCPGLDLDYDVNLYGLPFAKVIKEQQVAGRAATHASAPYKWAHDMMEKTVRQAGAEGILQKREAGQVGWAVKSKAEQEAGCRAVLAAARARAQGRENNRSSAIRIRAAVCLAEAD